MPSYACTGRSSCEARGVESAHVTVAMSSKEGGLLQRVPFLMKTYPQLLGLHLQPAAVEELVRAQEHVQLRIGARRRVQEDAVAGGSDAAGVPKECPAVQVLQPCARQCGTCS